LTAAATRIAADLSAARDDVAPTGVYASPATRR
jgi:hypothetical protein